MKTYLIIDPIKQQEGLSQGNLNAVAPDAVVVQIFADFIYAQPSGSTTLQRYAKNSTTGTKSEVIAVIPSNLLVIEVA